MKKTVLILLVLLALPLPAHADVIVEPENAFYQRHRGEMEYEQRGYYVNGEDGWLPVVEEPGSDKVLWTVQNGEVLRIMFLYADSWDFWGVAERRTNDRWESGWVPMDRMVLKYDAQSFEEDHSFTSFNGTFERVSEAQTVTLWTYPGSGEVAAEWDTESVMGWLGNMTENIQAYDDPDGREWVYIPYLGGIRNVW
ncbi:MAG: hypothetical protein LBR72_06820, partial [Oscillospiraceae bacterium]|nr:hypothetical protein [Oscillospiraceae bacterium]